VGPTKFFVFIFGYPWFVNEASFVYMINSTLCINRGSKWTSQSDETQYGSWVGVHHSDYYDDKKSKIDRGPKKKIAIFDFPDFITTTAVVSSITVQQLLCSAYCTLTFHLFGQSTYLDDHEQDLNEEKYFRRENSSMYDSMSFS